MECLKAQEVISSALDPGARKDPALESAKDHCRSCPECGRLVKALLAVRQAELPEPPPDLTDRIMVAVTAEAVLSQKSDSVASPVTPMPAVEAPSHGLSARPVSPASLEDLGRRLLRPENRRALIAWTAAAAVIFVAAGIGAISGVRGIVSPTSQRMASSDAATEYQALESAPVDEGGAADTGAAKGATALSSPTGLIEVAGAVYRFAGPDPSVSPAALSQVGRTRSNLGEGISSERTVYGTQDPARVFIRRTDSETLAFDRVTRSFQGATYVLQSGPIPSFEELATLPAAIREPSSSDGSPTFELAAGPSDSAVYVLRDGDAAAGIALPPGAEPSLSSGWTWWVLAR